MEGVGKYNCRFIEFVQKKTMGTLTIRLPKILLSRHDIGSDANHATIAGHHAAL